MKVFSGCWSDTASSVSRSLSFSSNDRHLLCSNWTCSYQVFRQHNLDREIPEGVFWGRFEVQLIIETLFGASSLSMELAVQYALTLAIATVTALRPGGLGYSHREWCGLGGEDSKVNPSFALLPCLFRTDPRFAFMSFYFPSLYLEQFLQNKDLRIQRDLERGRGAFILHLKVRHMKVLIPVHFSP